MSTNDLPIPQFVPSFGEEEAKACYNYISSGGFLTEFTHTKEFERLICQHTGAKHAFAVNNGTLSLVAALLAFGVGVGDEVIVPNLTMIASPNAVRLIGAIPVLCDVDHDTITLDVEKAKLLLSPRTRAIMHVSLNGRCSESIYALKLMCKEHGLWLLEDAAQSLGSRFRGKNLGTFGDIGSFSFSPPKIISTGQGGALITDNDDLALAIRRVKDFGRLQGGGDIHTHFGINMKFTDVQALIGIEQMKKLPGRITRNHDIWNEYFTQLSELTNVIKMIKPNDNEWTVWFVDIFLKDKDTRDKLREYLKSRNIGTRDVYSPINEQVIYASSSTSLNDEFYESKLYGHTGLWLPSSNSLTKEDITRVCDCIKEFFRTLQ